MEDVEPGKLPERGVRPLSGTTVLAPRCGSNLATLLHLTDSDTPIYHVVRGKVCITTYYGFVDASSSGFGQFVKRPGGVSARFGLWEQDLESSTSNFRELCNLVEAVEEEAKLGLLRHLELWIFTNNSTAEFAFHNGSSLAKILHSLVKKLRKVEMECGVTLHVLHVTGTCMIAQGTDGLSQGSLMEGVMTGKDMLSYINIATSATERHPVLVNMVRG